MANVEAHRRKLSLWRRALLLVPAVAFLLAPYLVATRAQYPDLFWSAVALLVFVGVWTGGHAAWHYWVLRGVPPVE